METLTIVKFGGSIITDKTEEKTPNLQAMRMLVEELKEHITLTGEKVIVVNGGGSFPHPVAKKFHLNEGVARCEEFGIRRKDALLALSECGFQASTINHLLWKEFLKQGVAAFSFRPSSMFLTRKGEVVRFYCEPLKRFLGMGGIPLLYGDVVLDLELGNSILSGEKIIATLVEYFATKRVIMCTNVDGIYDKDPRKYEDAKKIETFSEETFSQELELTEIFKTQDATGGMKHKVETLFQLMKKGVDSILCNGGVKGNLSKALKGINSGTEFKARRE